MQYRRVAHSRRNWLGWTAAVLALAGAAFAQAPAGKEPVPAPNPAPPKTADPKTPGKPDAPAPTPPAAPNSEGSTLPETPKPRETVEIVTLSVGQDGSVRRLKGFGGSFLTDTAESLQIRAEARVKGNPALTQGIRWEITPPLRFSLPPDARLAGPKLDLRLVRKGGNPQSSGGPLTLTVKATSDAEGAAAPASVFFTQDDRDRLRQEYVDLARADVPGREDLVDEGEFYRRFGRKYRGVRFDALNTSRNPATGLKYPAIPLTEELVRTIYRTEKEYGRPVQVTSGFRNPVRQDEVHAGVEESHHQYGRAVDFYVMPRSVVEGKIVASEQDWLKLASAGLRAGGAWIEPMADCGVNTQACHVHVDVRPGGPQSRLVVLQGRITDPGGNPQAGATVRLAGMPIRTNADGRYLLKHILFTPQEELSVELPGRGPINRQVSLVENPVVVDLTVPADPQPTLIARVESAQRDSAGTATLRVSFKNAGLSEAKSVKLAISVADPKITLGEVTPAELASIPSGGEGACNVRVSVSANDAATLQSLQAMLSVGAVYQTPAGQSRTQSWKLMAQVDPSPQAPTAAVPAQATAQKAGAAGTVLRINGRGGVDFGAAAGGLLLGALAGAFSFYTRPRRPVGEGSSEEEPQPEAEAAAPPYLPVQEDPAALASGPNGELRDWEETDAGSEEPVRPEQEVLPAEAEPAGTAPRLDP